MFAQLSSTTQRLKRTLMLATATLTVAAMPAFADMHGDKKDIVDTAVAAGQFNTLVTAVTAAGLVETLKGEGPFTVFAPNDAAFAKIPKADLDALLADKEKLTAVLTYHVVPGKLMAADLTGKSALKTVQGGELMLDTSNGVSVDGASVVAADIETSNGVIHVIDSVVLPK
ncbi:MULTISPECIES: fasciclin domain-containing protein [Pseudomonas]|uniref:Fasciclin domain-containing protein n=1 Tax=Pseudomonas spirodelae TaxID=3101751 RepID=A0ABU5P637_9PSED|nr:MULTISPECIES: fasciclin domain-containing protein [unclassified Pseudomonas]MBU0901423.1 fasciclin domain-containing protein [Gammaproteobacteria bacterium]MDD2159890.1 fasciclin domain-containing protein [Pseudomonas sp. MIL19]MEA1605023.1 fasciclin domain-containing protein [Pseudomonas sp. T5W1]